MTHRQQEETNVLLIELAQTIGDQAAHEIAWSIRESLPAATRAWWDAPQPPPANILRDGARAAAEFLRRFARG